MTKINVYDIESEELTRLADDNETTIAEIIEMLMCYVDDLKREFNLK